MAANDSNARALTLVPATLPTAPATDRHEPDHRDLVHPLVHPELAPRDPQRRDPARHERAFALYLAGYRTTQIADQFHVTDRTVRYWLRDKREDAAKESLAERPNRLIRAIEAQRAISAAAWTAYEDLRERDRLSRAGQLDLHARRVIRTTTHRGTDAAATLAAALLAAPDLAPDAPTSEVIVEDYRRPQLGAQIAKYLSIVATAQREIARLQGLYDLRPTDTGQDTPPIIISHQPDAPSDLRPMPPEASSGNLADASDAADQNDAANIPHADDLDDTDGDPAAIATRNRDDDAPGTVNAQDLRDEHAIADDPDNGAHDTHDAHDAKAEENGNSAPTLLPPPPTTPPSPHDTPPPHPVTP